MHLEGSEVPQASSVVEERTLARVLEDAQQSQAY